jgi:molybdenum cofactor synthesis domain-containing protein
MSVEEALEIVLGSVQPLPVIEQPVSESAGLILAEDVRAPVDLPAFRNSAMDGFALRSVDTASASAQQPRELDVVGSISAGEGPWSVWIAEMTAVRVMTGAPVPDGADAVVRLEEAGEVGSRIRLHRPISAGEHLREIGSDLARGGIALPAGSSMTWPAIALLTALGISNVRVHARPVLAVISTGDELINAGTPASGQMVPDSNGPMLMELARAHGGDSRFIGIAVDSRAVLEAMLDGSVSADAIVISGGVSAGDRDVVRDLLAEREAVVFSQVRMKPGRPFTFGLLAGKPVFALPGNPLAAAAAFLQFVRPALDRMRGSRERRAGTCEAIAVSRIENAGRRRLIVPIHLRERPGDLPAAAPIADGTSGLALLARADGLLVIPEETAIVNQGDVVRFWRLPA